MSVGVRFFSVSLSPLLWLNQWAKDCRSLMYHGFWGTILLLEVCSEFINRSRLYMYGWHERIIASFSRRWRHVAASTLLPLWGKCILFNNSVPAIKFGSWNAQKTWFINQITIKTWFGSLPSRKAIDVLFHDDGTRQHHSTSRSSPANLVEWTLPYPVAIDCASWVSTWKKCFGTAAWEDTFYRDMRVVKLAFLVAGLILEYSLWQKSLWLLIYASRMLYPPIWKIGESERRWSGSTTNWYLLQVISCCTLSAGMCHQWHRPKRCCVSDLENKILSYRTRGQSTCITKGIQKMSKKLCILPGWSGRRCVTTSKSSTVFAYISGDRSFPRSFSPLLWINQLANTASCERTRMIFDELFCCWRYVVNLFIEAGCICVDGTEEL